MFVDAIQYDEKWDILAPHGTGASIAGLDVYSGGICELDLLD